MAVGEAQSTSGRCRRSLSSTTRIGGRAALDTPQPDRQCLPLLWGIQPRATHERQCNDDIGSRFHRPPNRSNRIGAFSSYFFRKGLRSTEIGLFEPRQPPLPSTGYCRKQPRNRVGRPERSRTQAAGQQVPLAPLEIERITDKVFALRGGGPIMRAGKFTAPVSGTTIAFVTKSGVILVDTRIPETGQELIQALKKITELPVTVIINTHRKRSDEPLWL